MAFQHRLTLISGVAKDNDNVVGDFRDEKTAYLVAELLWALDRCDSPEYSGFHVSKELP